ncbi:MAG: hypothetical protein ACREEE_00275 [Dongiaceae bacterium]
MLRDALPDTIRERIAADAAKLAAPKPSDSAPGTARPAAKSRAPAKANPEAAPSKVEDVSIGNDGELVVFVRRLLAMAQNQKQRDAIQAGRLKFRLKQAHPASPSSGGGTVERIDKGLVTERKLLATAKSGKNLVLAKGVVLTPLARDKARQLGVQIERE